MSCPGVMTQNGPKQTGPAQIPPVRFFFFFFFELWKATHQCCSARMCTVQTVTRHACRDMVPSVVSSYYVLPWHSEKSQVHLSYAHGWKPRRRREAQLLLHHLCSTAWGGVSDKPPSSWSPHGERPKFRSSFASTNHLSMILAVLLSLLQNLSTSHICLPKLL